VSRRRPILDRHVFLLFLRHVVPIVRHNRRKRPLVFGVVAARAKEAGRENDLGDQQAERDGEADHQHVYGEPQPAQQVVLQQSRAAADADAPRNEDEYPRQNLGGWRVSNGS
jgi:hypothetical protein